MNELQHLINKLFELNNNLQLIQLQFKNGLIQFNIYERLKYKYEYEIRLTEHKINTRRGF